MLPYATEGNVAKYIDKKLKESQPTPEPTEKNKYPVLNYTLEEIKQYKNLPESELPQEFVDNITEYVYWIEEQGCSTYAEFHTKDGYAFKGNIVFCWQDSQNYLPIELNSFVCIEDAWKATLIKFLVAYDPETGDGRMVFHTIEVRE